MFIFCFTAAHEFARNRLWRMATAGGEAEKERETEKVLSVLLPVYNAMPWLPIAVRDMLKQDLGGEGLELICADDASRDSSLAFLRELAALLGDRAAVEDSEVPLGASQSKRARIEAPVTSEATGGAPSTNPALLGMALRAAETADHPSFKDQDEPDDLRCLREDPVTAAQVAAACRPEHRLTVLRWADGVNRGQGAAMSACLSRVSTPFLAQMESDDEREDAHAFRKMLQHLRDNEALDGVSCLLKVIGWKRPGMERYVEWQNSCVTAEEMRKGRFIEQPALHQTALFRTAVVREVTGGAYRDGTNDDDDLDVPVDMWWWLSFFHSQKRCSKVAEPLFSWRQHPRQHTRTHGRLSIDNLRKIKVHFLLRPQGPAHGRPVEVWSVGKSLEEWRADISAHPCAPASVTAVSWKPGMPLPDGWKQPPRQKNPKGRKGLHRASGASPGLASGKRTEEGEGGQGDAGCRDEEGVGSAGSASVSGDLVAGVSGDGGGQGVTNASGESIAIGCRQRPVRLFVFGMAKARRTVRSQIRDWDDSLDWFVA